MSEILMAKFTILVIIIQDLMRPSLCLMKVSEIGTREEVISRTNSDLELAMLMLFHRMSVLEAKGTNLRNK